jgi:predicted amidophosphoribosyltransferase
MARTLCKKEPGMQSPPRPTLIRILYPPQCLSCDTLVEDDFALCPACWRDTPFITGLTCHSCGTPLPGDSDIPVHCDDCLTIARPWEKGRSALLYKGNARDLILKLKHADRMDLAPAAARWLHRAAAPLLCPGMMVAPVPLHWFRLIRRRYNQSALLSAHLAALANLPHCPDLLIRTRCTPPQDHKDRDARFRNLTGAIRPHPRRLHLLKDRDILLVDDVMTSGATLAAATEACLAAGANRVSVAVLARVAKDA